MIVSSLFWYSHGTASLTKLQEDISSSHSGIRIAIDLTFSYIDLCAQDPQNTNCSDKLIETLGEILPRFQSLPDKFGAARAELERLRLLVSTSQDPVEKQDFEDYVSLFKAKGVEYRTLTTEIPKIKEAVMGTGRREVWILIKVKESEIETTE